MKSKTKIKETEVQHDPYQTIYGPRRQQFMFETDRAVYTVEMRPSYSPITGGLQIDSQLRRESFHFDT